MLHDEKSYWHEHVDQICASLVKYFGIFNHIKKKFFEKDCETALFAFIYSRIHYGIETYGTCAKETPAKVQIMQNEVLKLLLKWDRRSPTDLIHCHLSILKINDMHTAKSCHLSMNADLVESPIFLSIIIKFGKQDLTEGIEAVLIFHGPEPIWVLADAMSKSMIIE